MEALVKKEQNSLIEIAQQILEAELELKSYQETIKKSREFLFQGMKKNRLKSLKMDDGTVFVIREGNRKVVIKDQVKAEEYLEEMNCWKIDQTKLLKIFGHDLKVPAFFAIERGEQTLAIIAPKPDIKSLTE